MPPHRPHDRTSREQRVQLRSLDKVSDQLRSILHLHGVDPESRPHLERALAHVREAVMAIEKVDRARTVDELVKDLQTGEQLIQKISQFCGDRSRGIGTTH